MNRLNARFAFVSSGVQGHLLQTYCCFFIWVSDLGFIWETCQSAKCRMERGRAENFKSTIKNSSAVATFGKYFKSQHCSRLHKYVNGCFPRKISMFLSLVAKAKTRVTGSLGHNWARLAIMDGLVPASSGWFFFYKWNNVEWFTGIFPHS